MFISNTCQVLESTKHDTFEGTTFHILHFFRRKDDI